ncbi:hypothetical protein L4X63_19850 [Geomonas sp. Red32]|uniref:hypothetical protein n=1 Tax=Geomonas sp. Red32 TaxID=2912856 RepID=UPI00202CBC90|nr:hypothetical protein [Geomonas sp. Red32]MCM0083844.1 hypothetical protein [Geomonas sp. Red32]
MREAATPCDRLPIPLIRCFLSLLILVTVSGCTFDRPRRPYSGDALKPSIESCTSRCTKGEDPPCVITCRGESPAENRTFENYSSNRAILAKGNYLVGYVEFDDQGWFHDKRQRNAIFDAIADDRERYRRETGRDRQYLIAVFAHGWKHNADGDDDNVKEFNKLLERLDVQEQLLAQHEKRDARKVAGIYLAWRGLSLKIPGLNNITFWNRKNAGERVGDRSAKQLLIEINNLRANLNGWQESGKLASNRQTQLFLIGHSFGGLLMYHAVHSGLIDRGLYLERRDDGTYHFDTAKSFGDFILLVNPAFEGAAYEPLFEAGKSRCFPPNERPIMVVVTSKSDWATGVAFPLGRLYTLTQTAPHPGERAAIMGTVGHLDRYKTHDITYDPSHQPSPLERTSGLSITSVSQALENLRELAKAPEAPGKLQRWYDGVRLDPTPVYTGHLPYLVMSADRSLIKDHDDIWNDRFIQFVTAFVTKEVMSKGAEPPQQKEEKKESPEKPLPAVYRFWLEDSKHCPQGNPTQKPL